MAPGEAQSDWACPRVDVYDVKYVRHSGNLVVRIRGREMFEVRPERRPGDRGVAGRDAEPGAVAFRRTAGGTDRGATPEKP